MIQHDDLAFAVAEVKRLRAINADLLAALEPLVASLEYEIQHGLLFGLVEPTERLLAAARAAIARAIGAKR